MTDIISNIIAEKIFPEPFGGMKVTFYKPGSFVFETLNPYDDNVIEFDIPEMLELLKWLKGLENEGVLDVPRQSHLYGKYRIAKADGSPIDPNAQYFVLRIDTDQAARMALITYANYIEHDEPEFSAELRQWLEDTYPPNKPLAADPASEV